jgi:ferredoxin
MAGIPIYGGIQKVFNCHGLGHCAGCRVHIKKGMENVSHMGLLEKANPLAALSRIGHESEARLACRCEVNGDIEVESTPGLNWHGERFWS